MNRRAFSQSSLDLPLETWLPNVLFSGAAEDRY
jgi:hypothetical protein